MAGEEEKSQNAECSLDISVPLLKFDHVSNSREEEFVKDPQSDKKQHKNPHHVDYHVEEGLIKYASNVLIDTQQKFILNAVHKYIL